MFLKTWRCITIVLAALALTMESALVLELPQKMQYAAPIYAAVNTTLYRYFAIVGGVYQVGSIVMAAVLTFLVRKRRPAVGWTLTGAGCLLLAFGIWLAVVAPVNSQVAAVFRSAPERYRQSGCGCATSGSMDTWRDSSCSSSGSARSCSRYL